MSDPRCDDESFHLELIKLLLQVAWADDELDPDEGKTILALGKSWGLPAPELAVLAERIDAREPLPPPNLGLLRTRKAEVLQTVRDLAHSDGMVHTDEHEMIDQLEALLD